MDDFGRPALYGLQPRRDNNLPRVWAPVHRRHSVRQATESWKGRGHARRIHRLHHRAMVAVGIQYLLFRSLLAVFVATVLAGGAADVVTQRSLKHFENAMRYNLGIISQTSTMIYTEVTNQEIFG